MGHVITMTTVYGTCINALLLFLFLFLLLFTCPLMMAEMYLGGKTPAKPKLLLWKIAEDTEVGGGGEGGGGEGGGEEGGGEEGGGGGGSDHYTGTCIQAHH